MKKKKAMPLIISLSILSVLLLIYGFLWIMSAKSYPVEYGISFNQIHAQSLKLDWKQTYIATLEDLKPKYIRVAAMWSEVESEKGTFDFSDVDFMMDKAEEYGAKVTLVVGQKAPRWPECHVPDWYTNGTEGASEHLMYYVRSTVERYKNHPALEIWQVENEPYIRFRFGECSGFNESAVEEEIRVVKSIDPNHKILITDSGELSTWRRAGKAGDLLGTTLYRIVRGPSGNIFTYDWLPASTYRYKAMLWGKSTEDFFVSELQAEPWFSHSDPLSTTMDIQMQTMSPDRLDKHFEYTEKIGVSRAYLWGVEWWYWVKEVKKDDVFWEKVKEKIAKTSK